MTSGRSFILFQIKPMIKLISNLEIFKLSYSLAMEVFRISKSFPKEEKYSLVDQMIRSARSIAANIAEGWGKRIYENEFKKHLIYSLGSLEELKVWLLFAKDCLYIEDEFCDDFHLKCDQLGAKIYKLYENWKSF
jgi:four helix bundle protein